MRESEEVEENRKTKIKRVYKLMTALTCRTAGVRKIDRSSNNSKRNKNKTQQHT